MGGRDHTRWATMLPRVNGEEPEVTVSVALVTGSAGLIGSEAVRHFAGLGLDVVGIDNDMRAQFFGAGGLDRVERASAHDPSCRTRTPTTTWTSGTGTRSPRSSGRTAGHRGRHPHRRPAVARLGRAGSVHRLRRQRRRHAERAAERPGALHRGTGDPLLHQQGLRRPAEHAAADGARDPVGDRAGPPVRRRHPRGHVDRRSACTRSSAPRRSPPT